MNKLTTINRNTPLLWEEDEVLERHARKSGMATAGKFREIFYDWLKQNDPVEFKRLLAIRLAHTRAITLNIGRHAKTATMLFFAVSIPFLSTQPNFEARRPRRNGMAVRLAAHSAWKQEIAL